MRVSASAPECPECGAPLKGEGAAPGGKFVELMSSFNPAEASFISSVLEAEGIEFMVFNENFPFAGAPAVPMKILVREDKLKEAKAIFKSLE